MTQVASAEPAPPNVPHAIAVPAEHDRLLGQPNPISKD
jgi:hypothetical protein